MVTRAQADGGLSLKTAAAMIEEGDIEITVKSLWNDDKSEEMDPIQKVQSILTLSFHAKMIQEIELLTIRTNETPLEPFDIISDRRSVASLCLLYTSMASSLKGDGEIGAYTTLAMARKSPHPDSSCQSRPD